MHSWREAGLFPVNPTRVLDKMTTFGSLQKEQTPDSKEDIGIDQKHCKTSGKHTNEISRYTRYIDSCIFAAIDNENLLTSLVTRTIAKRNKAIKIRLIDADLAEIQLKQKKDKEIEKSARKNGTCQEYGISADISWP